MKFFYISKEIFDFKIFIKIDKDKALEMRDNYVLLLIDNDKNFLEKILNHKENVKSLIILTNAKDYNYSKYKNINDIYIKEFVYKNTFEIKKIVSEIEDFIENYMDGMLINFDTEKKQMMREIEMLNLKLQEKINEVHNLYTIGLIIASNLVLENALTLIMDYAINLIDGEVGAILLKKDKVFTFDIVWGITPEVLSYIKHRDGKNIFEKINEIDNILVIEDFQKSDYYVEAQKFFIKSLMIIPLKINFMYLGVILLINKNDGTYFTLEDAEMARGISTYASIAIHNAQLHKIELEKKVMEKELAVASDIQMALLPKYSSEIEGLDIIAMYRPARAVGGDYYDIIPRKDGKTAIVIGDVSNKGVPASLLMVSARSIIRAETQNSNSAKEILERVNNLLCSDNFYEKNMFITLFYSLWDSKTSTLLYSNGGHCWPMIIKKNGEIKYIENGGLVVGQFPGMPYEESEIILEQGDLIFFYTDGILEERNSEKKFFGKERLEKLIKENYHLPLNEIINNINLELDKFKGTAEQYDDRTIILMKKK